MFEERPALVPFAIIALGLGVGMAFEVKKNW
jgi:hypothetical protein